MRILQVIHDFLPHHAAGSELYCYYLSRQLARRHSVYLMFTEVDHQKPQYYYRRSSYFGIPYYEVIHNHLYRRFEDTYADPRMDRVFARILDEVKPDVVHLHHLLNHSIGYIGIARRRGIPVVFTLHDYWLTCPNGGQRIRPDLQVCETIEEKHCADCIRKFGGGGRLAVRVASLLRRRVAGELIDRLRWATVEAPRREFVREERFALGGFERRVLVAHPPARIAWDLDVRPGTSLRFGVGMSPGTFEQPGGGVTFEVRAGGRSLWSRSVDPKNRLQDRRWIDDEVALPAHRGKVEIELITRPESGEDNRFCTGGWAEPTLHEAPSAQEARQAPWKSLYRAAERLLALEGPARRAGWASRRLQRVREACRSVDLFLAPSPFLRRKMIEFGLPEERIVLSDYGMPVDRLQPFQRRPSEALRFGYVGTLVPHKGVHILLEAFAKLRGRVPDRRLELRVHGNPRWFPDYAARLRAMAGAGPVAFLGPFDNREAAAVYAEIDVLVVPSLWWENAPITIHEAILTGTPVIAPDFGGMADFVQEGRNGLLFRVGDADDLARRMFWLAEDPARLESLRQPAVPIKAMERDAAEMEQRYLELLGAPSVRRALAG